MHTAKLMRRLQKALIHKGDIVKINTIEFYSADKQRMITKYIVNKKVLKKNKKGEEVYKDELIIESCSQIDVVYKLVERVKKLEGVGDG